MRLEQPQYRPSHNQHLFPRSIRCCHCSCFEDQGKCGCADRFGFSQSCTYTVTSSKAQDSRSTCIAHVTFRPPRSDSSFDAAHHFWGRKLATVMWRLMRRILIFCRTATAPAALPTLHQRIHSGVHGARHDRALAL